MSDSELSFKQVAVNKNLEMPEDSGIITFQIETSLKGAKGRSVKDLEPTDEEMELINENALVPQEKKDFIILRNVNPIGDPKAVDSHLDKFSRQAEKDLVEGAPNTPLLVNHDHDINNAPPVGMVISSKLTNKGPRETIAIALDAGNDGIIKGITKGFINKLSVGIQVYHADTLCNSCDKATSIYSSACPHMPGQKDEKGNITTKTINKVARYLERSLVNVPARLGTSTKSLEADLSSEILNNDVFEKSEIVSLDSSKDARIQTLLNIAQSADKPKLKIEALKAINTLAAPQNNTSDTITPVNKTTEDNPVMAEDQKTVTPEEQAVLDAAKQAELDAEVAKAAEDKAKAEAAEAEEKAKAEAEASGAPTFKDFKSLKLNLSDESESTIKALTEAATETNSKVEKLLETVNAQVAVIAKQAEQLEASAKQIEALTKLQEELVKTVDKAVGVTTEDVMNKFMEVVKAASEHKKAQAAASAANGDILSQFGV